MSDRTVGGRNQRGWFRTRNPDTDSPLNVIQHTARWYSSGQRWKLFKDRQLHFVCWTVEEVARNGCYRNLGWQQGVKESSLLPQALLSRLTSSFLIPNSPPNDNSEGWWKLKLTRRISVDKCLCSIAPPHHPVKCKTDCCMKRRC